MSKSYSLIDEYFQDVRQGISLYQSLIVSSQITYETRTTEEGTIYGLLRFIDQSELHIREYVFLDQGKVIRSTYRYHWQDKKHTLITRWDNAPHHHELPTFPHHKHLPSDVIGCDPQTFLTVLKEISHFLTIK